jgi:hypothetical protein
VNSYNYYVNDDKVGSTEVMPKWEISIFRELPEIPKKKSIKRRARGKATAKKKK